MIIGELETHLTGAGYKHETVKCAAGDYLVLRGVAIGGGTHAGKTCDVAIKRTSENPWVPDNCVHVRPALVTMGQASSQPSPVGPEWQYLSRRFDRAPTPKSFLAHILTVLGEL